MKGQIIAVTGHVSGLTNYYSKLKNACEDYGVSYNTVTSYFRRMSNKGTPSKSYTSKSGITLTKTQLI